MAGLSSSYLGALRSRLSTGEVRQAKIEEIAKLARAANVSVEWLMGGETGTASDPSIDQFLKRLDERPELVTLLRRGPWRLSTVVRALDQTTQSDSAGRPMAPGGWKAILDAIEGGELDARPAGDVRADTRRQIGRRPRLPK